MSRIEINMHLHGTIAIEDFVKIAALMTPHSYDGNQASALGASAIPAATAIPIAEPLSPVMPELETVAPPPPPVDEEPEASVADGNGVDAKGVPFDPALHTGTLKKDGTWRLKKGAAAADETPPPPPPAVDEDDEFAAFASAEAAPVPAPVARKWTDADLSKLCNQGASKDGNPDRVKTIIGKYVPAGEVQHSRNIPADVREAFAQELESTIGIQYAG